MTTDGSAPGRTIALMNQKGGVGKTTTTVSLGAAMAARGTRVLVVDLDPQAHATLHLGHEPGTRSRSVYDLLMEPDVDPHGALVSISDNLALVPSETDLAAAETELTTLDNRHTRLARALASISRVRPFDVALIDCPPALGLMTINALGAAGDVIIPMQAHFLALQGVGKLLETVRLVAAQVNPRLRVSGVVLCMHDAQTTLSQEVTSDLEAFFDEARGTDVPWSDARIFEPPIRRNIKLAECPSFGKTIFDYAPTAAGAEDYARLAAAILEHPQHAQGEEPSRVPEVHVREAGAIEVRR